jgi:proline dehydrogenase
MALPRLKDYLSTELDLGRDVPPASAVGEARAALDEYERSLDRIAEKAERLRQALNRFVGDVEGFQALTEADAETALREIESLESRTRSSSREGLRAAETRRKKFALLRDGDLKFRAVALHDREVKIVRSILAAYDLAKRRLLKLRDQLLVHEAQKLSAGAFWGDDDL